MKRNRVAESSVEGGSPSSSHSPHTASRKRRKQSPFAYRELSCLDGYVSTTRIKNNSRHSVVGCIAGIDSDGLSGSSGRIRLGLIKFYLPKWNMFFIHLYSCEEGESELASVQKASKAVNTCLVTGTVCGVDMSPFEKDRFWVGENEVAKVTLFSDSPLWDREFIEEFGSYPNEGKDWIKCTECEYLIDENESSTKCRACHKSFHSDCLFVYEKKPGPEYDPVLLDEQGRRYAAAAKRWKARKSTRNPSVILDESEGKNDIQADTNDPGNPPQECDIGNRSNFTCRECRRCRYCCHKLREEIITSVPNPAAIEPVVVCIKCNAAAHGYCVFPAVPRLHSSVQWVCDDCRECNSCGRVTYLNESTGQPSLLTEWALPSFDQCKTCFAGLDKGEYCPVCMKAWSVEWGGDMVQCDLCEFWVHVGCDDLRCVNLSKLKSDQVKYNCPICRDTSDIQRRRRVIDLLRAIDKVALFSEPVSASLMPVYAKVIKNPMDLSKMRKRNYSNNYEFIRDFELIIENAKVFNMPNSPAYRLAEQFHKQGKLLIEKYLLMDSKGANKIEGLVTVEEPDVEIPIESGDAAAHSSETLGRRAASIQAGKMWKKEAPYQGKQGNRRKRTNYEDALSLVKRMDISTEYTLQVPPPSGVISPYKRRLSGGKSGSGLLGPLSPSGEGSTTKPSTGLNTPVTPSVPLMTEDEIKSVVAKMFGLKYLDFLNQNLFGFGNNSVPLVVKADFTNILTTTTPARLSSSDIARDVRWCLYDCCSVCKAFGESWNFIECNDCGECSHWYCEGLFANPDEVTVPGTANPLADDNLKQRAAVKYKCKSCVKCKFCNTRTNSSESTTIDCCLCGAQTHAVCRSRYFIDQLGLESPPDVFRLVTAEDETAARTVCEDCVVSQALHYFKQGTCKACDSLINPSIASSFFKAMPNDSPIAQASLTGRVSPQVHCVACGCVWHTRCLPEFSDVSNTDILGVYVCQICSDVVKSCSGKQNEDEVRSRTDEILVAIGTALKKYRSMSYNDIQCEFVIESLRACGLLRAKEVNKSDPLLTDIVDIFQAASGGSEPNPLTPNSPPEASLSTRERQWIEWGLFHKEFLVGLGNPVIDTSRKKSSISGPTSGNAEGNVSVRIKRIEDEDLLLVKRLYSAYHFVNRVLNGLTVALTADSSVTRQTLAQALVSFPEGLGITSSTRTSLMTGSEIGARILQLWLQRAGEAQGYTGPGAIYKPRSLISVTEAAPHAWDDRCCRLCGIRGDHVSVGPLLPFESNGSWVHSECIAWSVGGSDLPLMVERSKAVETRCARPVLRESIVAPPLGSSLSAQAISGTDVSNLIRANASIFCCVCEKTGATVNCQSCHSASAFHLPCAIKVNRTTDASGTRVLMDSRCRLLTCGRCLYRDAESEKFFLAHFLTEVKKLKSNRCGLSQLRNTRHGNCTRISLDDFNGADTVSTGSAARLGSLSIVSKGTFPDEFVYDGSAALVPVGFSSVRLFWTLDLVLAGSDEQRGVSILQKDQSSLKKRRRSAYLCRISDDGRFYTIQVMGGRIVAAGMSISEVWEEFKCIFASEASMNEFPAWMTGEWFFGLKSDYMQRHLGSVAVKSIRKQAGMNREEWLYQPQLREYVIGALGLKSDLKPVTSVRRDLMSKIGHLKSRIDQLKSLGRQPPKDASQSVASDLLEPSLVLAECSTLDEGGNGSAGSSASSKPSRISKSQISDISALADAGTKYKSRSGIPDINVLAVHRSKIHNYGLFARNGFGKGEMVVEYQGEVLRQTIADEREKKAEREGDGDGGSCYMFKLDDDYVVDATVKGNCARFINHSCNPNCTCKMIEDDTRQKHIMIIAKRDIAPGEEITYDYQFAVESEKLACLCGAPNCLGRLN